MPQCPFSTAIKHTTLSIIQQPERNVGRRMHLSREWGGGRSPVPCQCCLTPDLEWRADPSFPSSTIQQPQPLRCDLLSGSWSHPVPPLPPQDKRILCSSPLQLRPEDGRTLPPHRSLTPYLPILLLIITEAAFPSQGQLAPSVPGQGSGRQVLSGSGKLFCP